MNNLQLLLTDPNQHLEENSSAFDVHHILMLHSYPIFKNDQYDSSSSHVEVYLPLSPNHFEEGSHMLSEASIDINLKISSTPTIIKFRVTTSPSEIQQLTYLCCEFYDIFTSEYLDMKGMDPNVLSHNITMNPGTKPVR